MPYSYSTNWMGPIRLSWIEENGDFWAGGRIDIRGDTESPYGDELGLPIMFVPHFQDFSSWLDNLPQTQSQWSFKDLTVLFESVIGYKIVWWKKDHKLILVSESGQEVFDRSHLLDKSWKSYKVELRLTTKCDRCNQFLKIRYKEPIASCSCLDQEWYL